MSEGLAFVVFVALVAGTLGAITVGMILAVIVLVRRNRREHRGGRF